MHILNITGIFPPDIGGPASYVPSISKALAEKGHLISVITLSDHTKHMDSEYPFKIKRIPRSFLRPLRFLKTVAAIISLGRKADLLFVHGLCLEAVAANLFLKKPLVHKIVGDLAWERIRTRGITEDSIDKFQVEKYSTSVEFLKKLRSFWTGKSSLIITPSTYLKKIVGGWGIREDKIQVIYNAVQHEQTNLAAKPELIRQIGGHNVIVSVGRLFPWKGFEDIIKAVANIRDAHLVIIGAGPEKTRLELLVADKKLRDRVHLTGMLPRNAVFAFLKHADVFVLNSAYEGLPHIVLEAMAAGTPVIATDTGGTAELVKDGFNGVLIPARAPEKLESSINKILGDKNTKKTLVQNGFDTLKQFSWETMVKKTEDVLVNTAKNKVPAETGFIKPEQAAPLPVLFISTARLGNPPDPTLLKKWAGLKPFFKSTIVSFRDKTGPFTPVIHGAQWILLPSKLPRPLRYLVHFLTGFVLSFFGALNKKYVAIVAQSPYEALAPALALLPWKILRTNTRPKLIIELHNDWKEGVMLYHRWCLSWIEKPIRTAIGRLSLSQADAYRAISDYCCSLLPESQKPLFVFPTFTDLESFGEPSEECVNKAALKHGQGFFLFVGMLIYLKGVHYLLRAVKAVAATHPEVRLIIAGKGPEEENLKKIVEDSELEHCVCFAGHLDQQTLGALIKNSTALVLPSLTEGLGRVAIEAHLLEKPVIASRVGGIPEIVEHGKTGFLFEPEDEDALKDALIKLLNNQDLAEQMGSAGKKAVADKFSYNTYFQSYFDMVRETCKK